MSAKRSRARVVRHRLRSDTSASSTGGTYTAAARSWAPPFEPAPSGRNAGTNRLAIRGMPIIATSITASTNRSSSTTLAARLVNQHPQAKLDEVTAPWGVKVTSGEIREIQPPRDLQARDVPPGQDAWLIPLHSRQEDNPHPVASASSTRRPASSHDLCARFFAIPYRVSWHSYCSSPGGMRRATPWDHDC